MAGRGGGAVLVGVLLAACGRSPLTLDEPEEFCVEYARRYDEVRRSCFGGSSASPSPLADFCGVIDGALARGASYDGTAAAACLAALDRGTAAACEATPSCLRKVVKGQIAARQPCSTWLDCADPHASCIATGNACGASTCVDLAANAGLGEACGGARSCEAAYRCEIAPGKFEGRCVEKRPGGPCATDLDCFVLAEFCDGGTCKPRIVLGGGCGFHRDGCVILAACDVGMGRCVAAGRSGLRCGGFGFCEDGYCYAFDDMNPAFGKCAAWKAAGAACGGPNECSSKVCGPGAVCLDCP